MQKTNLSRLLQGRTSSLRPWISALTLATGLLLTLGCDRDQVSRSAVAKEAPGAGPAMGSMPPGAELPPPPRPTGAGAMKWTLPKGWTETQGSGMRFATLTPPGAGKVELSVVVLPGAAGGELANVNRWRGQIGLPPMDEKALNAAKQSVQAKAGVVSLYDFSSDGQNRSRMITGLLATPDGNTWFLKLLGDAAPVGQAKPEFLRFLESLHLD